MFAASRDAVNRQFSDPTNPRQVGDYETNANGYDARLAVSGHQAYLVHVWQCEVLDISNPANPKRAGTYHFPFDDPDPQIAGVAVAGHHACVIRSDGLHLIDVSNPASPQRVGGISRIGVPRSAAVSQGRLLVPDLRDGLVIFQLEPFIESISQDAGTIKLAWESFGPARLQRATRLTNPDRRTDAGVHALNQVAHFITETTLDLASLHRGLNSLLPPYVVVKEMTEAPPDFHARYWARSRVYQYLIWNNRMRSPFYGRFSWQVHDHLDSDAMSHASGCLMGWHDFASFQGTGSVCRTSEREVMRCAIRGRAGRWIIFTVEANSFLRHMVRNIIGTLVEVGRSRLTSEEFKAILDAGDRSRAGVTAPPQGLFLKHVKY